MIKHIVLWTLKEENKEENAKEMVKRLNCLKDKIDEVVTIEAGINFVESERSFDVALYSEFKSVEDLDKYRVHEAHQEVVKYIRTVSEKVVAVDYKI
ncbi:Dabb family protein [Methanococcoides sp. SA1]|nr:Dabb family protein [Methanococcoides sp. SA1]